MVIWKTKQKLQKALHLYHDSWHRSTHFETYMRPALYKPILCSCTCVKLLLCHANYCTGWSNEVSWDLRLTQRVIFTNKFPLTTSGLPDSHENIKMSLLPKMWTNFHMKSVKYISNRGISFISSTSRWKTFRIQMDSNVELTWRSTL